MEAQHRTPNAAAVARHYRRKKLGAIHVGVGAQPALLDHLIDRGWLKAWDATNKIAVADALTRWSADAIVVIEAIEAEENFR
jgi:hypothetical protein